MIGSHFHMGDTSQPLIAFAIHNGHHMPPEMLPTCGVDEATRLREEDPYTGEFAAMFANHVVVKNSRFAFDLNRSPEHCIYQKPEDAWGLPVRTAPLSEELLQHTREDYDNWYSLMDCQIDRMLESHKRLLVLDLHSYNHRRLGATADPDPQIQNPDLILGRNILPESTYPLVEKFRNRLDGQAAAGRTLDCRCDIKFSGGHFSRWLNARYPDQVLCLAVEFKKIWMDEWTGEKDFGATRDLQQLFFSAVNAWLPEVMNP